MRHELQRAFTTFPAGWPGVGLLLLRVAVGGAMILLGAVSCADPQRATAWSWVVGVLAAASGVSLLIGFLTPVAGVAAGLIGVGISLRWPSPATQIVFDRRLVTVLVAVVAVAVALIGPGALSLDARLFGRREITIPQGSDPLSRD
jgi:putative oxidoreductase